MASIGAQSNRSFRLYQPTAPAKPKGECLGPYNWLAEARLPRMVTEALRLWHGLDSGGMTTTAAAIPSWEVACHTKAGAPVLFDPVPRAGIVMAVLARRAGKSVPEAPHAALNWANFGVAAGQPLLGDIVCSLRRGGGYVGLYLGEDDVAYHCIGATEADGIAITRFAKLRLYAARRPVYEGGRRAPAGIRLNRDGSLA